MFTMRTCLQIARKIFANQNHLLDAFNNLNIVNMISKFENTRNRSHYTYYAASFLSGFYQRPLGNPWSVNLIWNTGPGCEEKFCDLAFGCWLVKLPSIDQGPSTNKMLCQLHSEWQVYGRNSTYNRYNP